MAKSRCFQNADFYRIHSNHLEPSCMHASMISTCFEVANSILDSKPFASMTLGPSKTDESFRWPRFEHLLANILAPCMRYGGFKIRPWSMCRVQVHCTMSFSPPYGIWSISIYKCVGKIHSHALGITRPRAPIKYFTTALSFASSQVSPRSGVSRHMASKSSSASDLAGDLGGHGWP